MDFAAVTDGVYRVHRERPLRGTCCVGRPGPASPAGTGLPVDVLGSVSPVDGRETRTSSRDSVCGHGQGERDGGGAHDEPYVVHRPPPAYDSEGVNVMVPTSDGLPPEPPPRVRRLPMWLLLVVTVALVLVAVVVVVGAFSASEGSSSDDPDTSQQGPFAGGLAGPMSAWELMYFPGAGIFVDVMDHPDATVALARTGTELAAAAVGSAVWSLDAENATWYAVELEGADRAAVWSVAMVGGDVLIAGSVGEEPPTPTLWAGPAGGPFRIIDQPFSRTGVLHAIRRLDTGTVLLGQPIERSDDFPIPLVPSLVLVGEPGNWRDITPPDADSVTEIISHEGEWIAVGGRGGEAMAWHSMDRGSTWSEHPLAVDGEALLTHVTVVGGDVYAAAIIFDVPRAQLFRYSGSWAAVGEPRQGLIFWISDIDGELVGNAWFGRFTPELWRHDTGGRWSAVRMALPAAPEQSGPAWFMAADGGTVVGSVLGQPAMWRSGASGGTVLATAAEADRLWERVATLPADGPFVAFAGDVIIVVAAGLQSPTTPSLLVSRDGLEWEERELPTGLNVTAIREVGGHNVVVGVRAASNVVVGRFDDDAFEVMAEFKGALIDLDSSEHSITLYIRQKTVTTRYEIPIEPEGSITETPVAGRPVAIWPLGEGVVVRGESATFGWPPNGMSVSLDGGIDWTPVDVEPLRVFQVGTEIVVFTVDTPARTFRLEVDPIGLEEISLPPRFASAAAAGSMFEWADGLVIRAPNTFEYLAAIDADPVMLELSPRTGFNGAFAAPAAGDHVLAREGAEWVLYRWTGLAP